MTPCELNHYQQASFFGASRLLSEEGAFHSSFLHYQQGTKSPASGDTEIWDPTIHFLRTQLFTEKQKGEHSKEVADVYYRIALMYHECHKFGPALANYERALAILTKLFGPDSKEVIAPLYGVAQLQRAIKKCNLDHYERVATLAKDHFGPDSQEVAIARLGTIRALRSGRSLTLALAYFQKALQVESESFGAKSIVAAAAMLRLALVHRVSHR